MSETSCSSCGGSCGHPAGTSGGSAGGSAGAPQPITNGGIENTLSKIRHKIVVLSGKGGVGKSTVAVNMAIALSLAGKRVGLLDVDLHGPSVPRLLSLRGEHPHFDAEFMDPVPWSRNLWVMSVGFMLPNEDDPVIWKGALKEKVIRQFIENVAWGELDYLIVDCPPGTGDEPLATLKLLGRSALGLIVTTPQQVSVDDVRRSVHFCREMGNPILGVVENMSMFVCPECGTDVKIFRHGGGENMANEMGERFLGRIPLDPELVRAGDEGYAFVKVFPDSPTSKAVVGIAEHLLKL